MRPYVEARRHVGILGALLLLIAVAVAPAAKAEPLPTEAAAAERVLGNPDAPVTIIDYSSLTCSHCATFHVETLPALKERYIDTGKVKLVFRDFPFDRIALTAAMMARCVPEQRYFPTLDVLFKTQGQWARSSDPIKALAQIGKLAGLSQADFDACVGNKALADALLARVMEGQSKYKVEATPTFILNDGAARISGAQPIGEFSAAIDKLLAK